MNIGGNGPRGYAVEYKGIGIVFFDGGRPVSRAATIVLTSEAVKNPRGVSQTGATFKEHYNKRQADEWR